MAAEILDTRAVYEWDEWDVHEYFDFPDEPLEERLADVSGRGALALALAVGEWICHRYSTLSSDPAPVQFLEAAWAEQMQPDTASYTETEDDEWRGIVRGPLSIVITIANDALFALEEDDDTAVRAVWMINLARHVLPAQERFEHWLDAVVDRLRAHHPRHAAARESLPGDDYALGRSVARELFDTTRPFVPAEERILVDRFLALVDAANPFLAVNASFDDE